MSDIIINNINTVDRLTAVHSNAVVIANIVEVVSSVIKNIATSDVSETISSDGLSASVLGNIIANRIKEKVLNQGA